MDARPFEELCKLYEQARRKERKQRRRCALKCTGAQREFRRAQHDYLKAHSPRVVATVAANLSRPQAERVSLAECMHLARGFSPLHHLTEPVRVYRKPKASGGHRLIHEFGLQGRAAQRMLCTVMEPAVRYRDFQYMGLGRGGRFGVHAAVKQACNHVREGCVWVVELDIRDHYPSFEIDALLPKVPAPERALNRVAFAADQPRQEGDPVRGHCSCAPDARRGLPQGAATSVLISSWSVSQLHLPAGFPAELINYADNFFLFATTREKVEDAAKALREAIRSLPGGHFDTKGEDETPRHVRDGVSMLGHWISLTDDDLEIDPTQRQQRSFVERTDRILDKARQELKRYQKTRRDEGKRFLALCLLVRYVRIVNGWCSAFSLITDVNIIRDDRACYFHNLLQEFPALQFTKDEMRRAKDGKVQAVLELSSVESDLLP